MIAVSTEQADRINLILNGVPKGAEKALYSVMSRATATVRAQSKKQISEVYAITQKNIRAESTIKAKTEATNGGIVGTVEFVGYKIPLYRFDVSPKTGGQGKVVRARQLKSSSLTPFAHAFIATMHNPRNDHTGMFERVTSDRFPIEEKMGSSVPQMARNTVVMEKVERAARETVEKRVEHEISRILNGYGT